MDRNLIIFPTNGKNIQEVDSGITKVYLVVLGDGLTGESLYLDGHFSGDDITYRPEDLPVLDLLAAQDNDDHPDQY